MMEVETAAGSDDDHLMETEDQLENFSPVKLKEKKEQMVKGQSSESHHKTTYCSKFLTVTPIIVGLDGDLLSLFFCGKSNFFLRILKFVVQEM